MTGHGTRFMCGHQPTESQRILQKRNMVSLQKSQEYGVLVVYIGYVHES